MGVKYIEQEALLNTLREYHTAAWNTKELDGETIHRVLDVVINIISGFDTANQSAVAKGELAALRMAIQFEIDSAKERINHHRKQSDVYFDVGDTALGSLEKGIASGIGFEAGVMEKWMS